MDFEHATLGLDRIRQDDLTFRISSGHATQALRASIECAGLINPPILQSQGDHFRIVSGFGRVAVCRSLGWVRIPARCLATGISLLDCCLVAIADNAAQRTLNTVETARCFALIANALENHDECLQWLEAVGLSVNRDLADKLQRISRMNAALQQALIDGAIALPIALQLHDFEDAVAANEICALIQELDLSLNRQRELLDWMHGIALREHVPLIEVALAEPVAVWRQDREMDRGYKSQQIRKYFKKRRYPEITAFEERYARDLKKIKLAKGMQFFPPPHFESRLYRLQLDFINPHELNHLHQAIGQLLDTPAFLELLEPIRSTH